MVHEQSLKTNVFTFFYTYPEVENAKSNTFQDTVRTQHTFPFIQAPSAGCDDSLEEGV